MLNKFLLFTLSFFFGSSIGAFAVPAKVIIIRHANKIPGVNPLEGENHLDLAGYERAAALAYYFSGTPIFNTPPLQHIFAAGLAETDSSVRPIETCTPTANHYKLPLRIDFQPTQTKELAQDLLTNPEYNNSTVLVCWEHHNIQPLVIALGAEDPGKWSNDVFDQVYLLTFGDTDKPKTEKILQKLMFGDRATFTSPEPPTPSATSQRIDNDLATK